MADANIEYEQIILNSNKAALELLKGNNFSPAKTYLDTCLNILSSKQLKNHNKLVGITLNNYGCYYKRQGMLDKSLAFFQKAIHASTQAHSNVSETFLNISNVLSQNEKHEEALQAAFKALKSLDSIKQNPKIAVLAYKAMGTEFQYLGMTKESQRMFKKAEDLNSSSFRYSRRMTRDSVTPLSPSKFVRKPSLAKSSDRKFRTFVRTPEIEPTDRIFLDFIPAPVSFDGLLKKSPARSTDRFRSFTPKIMKNQSGSKSGYSKKLHPQCRICKGKSVVKRNKNIEILTPVPRRYKMSITNNRSYSPFL